MPINQHFEDSFLIEVNKYCYILKKNCFAMFRYPVKILTALWNTYYNSFQHNMLLFLIPLYFLRNYCLIQVKCNVFYVHRNTFNYYYRRGIYIFNKVLPPIIFANRLLSQYNRSGELFHNIFCILNGTECRIKKFSNWDNQALFYSLKKKAHMVK